MKSMDLGTKNANDLISKDFNTACSAAANVVNYKDIETFEKLSQQSDFLFDFIKQKIVKNLLDAVTKENYKNLFDFAHIYSADFEDIIVLGLVKFASQDLTDEMFELFENGDNAQKAYCAAYFSHVKDPICLDLLNKYAFCGYEPLEINCARALHSFNDKTIYNIMVEKLQSDAEDFEKFEALNFLVAYGDAGVFDALTDFMRKCGAFAQNIAASILSLKSFSQMIQEGKESQAIDVFDNIISGYPEVLSIDTVVDYAVEDFIKYLVSLPQDSYTDRIILKTIYKFKLISENDIYTFDLDKNTKKAVMQIWEFLNSLTKDYKNSLPQELSRGGRRAAEALEVIVEMHFSEFAANIAELAKNPDSGPMLVCECTKALKSLGAIDLVNKDEITGNISDENILALLNSYFS